MQRYRDRVDAGRRLATGLAHLVPMDPVVLGLPRGGVVVAATVAAALHAPLDVLVVRKVGAPGHAELALGAVGEDGSSVVNERVITAAGVGGDALARGLLAAQSAVTERARRLRGTREPLGIADRCVIIVDDGVATGATVRAGCQVARARGARALVVGVPVAPRATLDRLREVADEVVCPWTPRRFSAVGACYQDFHEVDDDEVVTLLASADRGPDVR